MSSSDADTGRRQDIAVGKGIVVTGNATLNVNDINFNDHHGASSRVQTLPEVLSFKEMKFREQSIADAHDTTCEWLIRTPQYLAWAAKDPAVEHHSLLWIKGHAGAGKSTLMKFAVEHARTTQKAIVLPHFFNARGTALEKSVEGMYRTLIVWLLKELPNAVTEELEAHYRRSEGKALPETWPVPELERLLKRLVERLDDQSVIFYIDALDECDVQEVRNMLWVFRSVVRKAWASNRRGQVRVCLASRPYPVIAFDEALYMDLSEQEEHRRDIDTYIHDRLYIGSSITAERLRQEVYRKASGIFMWVILVVHTLNQEYGDGNLRMIERRLEEIPAGLHELFRHTLERYPESQELLLVCFQWKLFELAELTTEQLWWGIQLRLGRKEAIFVREYQMQNQVDMEHYVTNASRGLLKIDKVGSDGPRVELIHESVRDFMLKDDGLQKLYGARDRQDFEAQVHEWLRDCCLEELISRDPRAIHRLTLKSGPVYVDEELEHMGWGPHGHFPLATYAAGHLLHHADVAQGLGRDQREFLEIVAEHLGPQLLVFMGTNRFYDNNEYVQMGIADIGHGIAGVLLLNGCRNLVRETQAQAVRDARRDGLLPIGLQPVDCLQDSSFRSVTLCDAFEFDWGRDSIQSLVELYLELEPRTHELQQLLEDIARPWASRSGWGWFGPKVDVPLLELSYKCPVLAIFFLIALAPSKSLDNHTEELRQLAFETPPPHKDNYAMAGDREYLRFLQVMHFFVEKDVTTDAMNFRNTALWYVYVTLSAHMKGSDILGMDVVLQTKKLLYMKYNWPPGGSSEDGRTEPVKVEGESSSDA